MSGGQVWMEIALIPAALALAATLIGRLQGGGALGAYQGGVYEELARAGGA